MIIRVILFILVSFNSKFTTAVKQNPFRNPKICGNPHCDEPFEKFSYTNSIYKYEYSIALNTEIAGTDGNASSLFLKASVEIFFQKPCDGVLRITSAKLWDDHGIQEDGTSMTDDDADDITGDSDDEVKSLKSVVDDYYGEFADTNGGDETTDEDSPDKDSESFSFEKDLKKHILRFSYQDGLIAEICPSSDESVWVLNIKRGILSTFQNTQLRFDVDHRTKEIDVSGACDVKYALDIVNDVAITLRKTKNITSCRNRYSTHSILQTTPYNFRDDLTAWPLLDSTSYCNITVENKVYKEVSCYEHHQLMPFSNHGSGATTTVFSRLTLQEEDNYSARESLAEYDALIAKRSTLIFDHAPSFKPTHVEIKLAHDMLKEICAIGFPNIQPEFINAFTNFLGITRQLDYEALTQLLYRATSICETGKHHVLDTLPYIGSSASYQLMRDQLLTSAVSKNTALSWLKSMSFIQRPDADAIETFYTILGFSRDKPSEPEYILCASAVIHSYCRNNPDCGQNTRVRAITESFEAEFLNHFQAYRDDDRHTYQRMVVILKSLGNIGILSEDFAEQLHEIIVNEFAPIGIRLESVFAFRRADCMLERALFLNIYANFSVNSEVRIASYLQAMRCPDYYLIKKVKSILQVEEINQVGSYVWSHLKNLAKSASPINIEVQSLLLDNDLSDKYKLDIRKFSHNFQHNVFFDEYNIGSSTDMNLIFGFESYLPRMLTLNHTAHLFGHSINFLEFSARAEGFEDLLANIFKREEMLLNEHGFKEFVLSLINNWLGAKNNDTSENSMNVDSVADASSYQNAITQVTLKNGTQNVGEFGSGAKCNQKCLATAKNLAAQRQKVQKGIANLGYKLRYDYTNPKLQLAVRIFGNDLHSYQLNGIPEMVEFAKEFDVIKEIYDILLGKEVFYTKSKVFLEAAYTVPLAVGVPLSIDLFGASAVDLRVAGKLEQMASAGTTGWNFNFRGRIKPTVLIEMVGKMQTNFFYEQSGIKVKSSLYSNSEAEGELKVRGQNLVSFSFSVPQKKTEFLKIRSEILKMMRNATDEPQRGVASRRDNSTCTWPLIDTAIGLKICTHYSVPNLKNTTTNSNYPSLLLSGPMNFSIVLEKSEQTAINWTFEYTKSMPQENVTKRALVILTPAATFQRSIVVNVNTMPASLNASLLFIHGTNKASAVCYYNGNNNKYRRFYLILDTNEKRNLDLRIELKRQQERNVAIYKPKMLLAINGMNVTGAIGTIRINDKNGIIQTEIDLSFETRKLQMLIRGILLQSEVSKSANITLNYRFQANKIESINFEGRLLNTGDKSKTEYNGRMQLKSTAHPRFNIASNMTWRSLQGHTEGVLAYNDPENFGNPDTTNVLHLLLARSYFEDKIWEGSRSNAFFSVLIPRSHIDAKISLKHEERFKNGTEHDFTVGLRLTPEREATVLFSLVLPRKPLLNFDAFFNISITRSNSCYGRLTFAEQLPKTYLVNFNGTWFTEQSIAIKANYKDHSPRLLVLKAVAESASFETTTIYASRKRNGAITFSNVHVKYGNDPYALQMQTNFNPDEIRTTICELHINLKNKTYWFNAAMLSRQPLTVQMEFHLDKLRDIYLRSSIMYLDARKELSLELNWDMNRDPSKRLLLLLESKKPSDYEHNGNILIAYPDRTLSCKFNTHTQGPNYYGDAYLSWDINEVVVLKYDIGLIPHLNGKLINNWIRAEIHTPFKAWRKNTLEAAIYNYGSIFSANTTIIWGENQNFAFIYKYDIKLEQIPLTFDLNFALSSSFKEMPSVNLQINHWNDNNKYVTDFNLDYNGVNETLKTYGWKSRWELIKDHIYKNVTGTILIISPHEDFWRGNLVTRFSIKDDTHILGAASLTVNAQEMTLSIAGHVKKLNDNMITVNITTPLNKLRHINGRFGLIESQRHFVAEVQTPYSALGIEVLFDVTALTDFDVKFSVALPVENLRLAALFAKLRSDSVDMRVKWNNATVGFMGVWFMKDLNDFEYSCQVFTPFEDFEENGYIVKFLKKDIFVLNLHCKISYYRLGIKLNGKPKSLILKQLGNKIVELETKKDDDFALPATDYSDVEDIDYEEFFSYKAEMQLDLIKWPTIEGVVDIDEILDYYFAVAKIKLPHGYININNNLYYPDYLNLVNIMILQTSYENWKEFKLLLEHHVDINLETFSEKLYYTFANKETTTTMNPAKKIGGEVKYSRPTDDFIMHPVHQLQISLALPNGAEIDVTGKMHLEDTMFNGSLNAYTGETHLTLVAALEVEENFFEGATNILFEENSIAQYACSAYIKQQFSVAENSLIINWDINNKNKISKFQAHSIWQMGNDSDEITSNGKILTNVLPIKTFEYALLLDSGKKPRLNLDLSISNQNGVQMDYGLRTIKNNEVVNMEMWTPLPNYKNISLHGTVIETSAEQYKIEGVLYRDMKAFDVKGVVNAKDGHSAKTRLQIQPQVTSNGADGFIDLSISQTNGALLKGIEIQLNAIENEKNCTVSGSYFYNEKNGIDLSMLVESTEPAIRRIGIISKWQSLENNRTKANLTLETPWQHIGLEKANFWTETQRNSISQGNTKGGYSIVPHKGNGKFEWSLKPAEDMRLLIESDITESITANSSYAFTELKYINPNKNFKELELGGKINFNTMWNFEMNGTLNYLNMNDIQFGVITQLPKSANDIHELKGKYRGNLISERGKNLDMLVEGNYFGKKAKRRCKAHLTYRNITDIRGISYVEWSLGDSNITTYKADIQMLKKALARREYIAKIITPKFGNNPTLFLIGSYDRLKDDYHYVNWSIDYPFAKRAADMDLTFQSLSNMNGYMNCSIPLFKAPWYKTVLNFSTTAGGNTHRFCRIDWPTDFAFISLHGNHTYHELSNILDGKIEIEVPINTRHRADIIYSLNEKPQLDKGDLKVLYNKILLANGIYQRKQQNSTILSEITDITLENSFKPIGIHLVNSTDLRSSKHSSLKRMEIFDLRDARKFNLTFELDIITQGANKDVILTAISPNRTVTFTNSYKKSIENNSTQKRGKLQLNANVWIEYNIVWGSNKMENHDVRNFIAELSYPKRKLSIDGIYFITPKVFNSNVTFGMQDQKNTRSLRTSTLWRTEPLQEGDFDNQTLTIILGHRLLEKDLIIQGNFYRGIKELIKTNLFIDYSESSYHNFKLTSSLKDLRDKIYITNYVMNFLTYHRASDFDVQINGSAKARASFIKLQSVSFFKKDFFTTKHGASLALLDLKNKEMDYMSKSPEQTIRLWIQPNITYPTYGLNATLWKTPETNNTGYIYIDMLKKEAHMYFNLSEDGTHNLSMFGYIPNARMSYLNIWRNYDELKLVDLASYIKLNHSRQITGRAHWRPKIKTELVDKMKTIKEALLNSFSENFDFWSRTVYVETLSALKVVWESSKEYNKDFINDIRKISVLEDDLEDLRIFINNSYEADDFYVKTIFNFTLTLVDESALGEHMGASLPLIFNEIQQVLGESGKALRRAIVQFIEMIKTTYNNIINTITSFFHGDSLKHLTGLMEKGFERYEKFMKDLHIAFIHQLENLWHKFSNIISSYLRELLKRIEPHIFEAITFVEETTWNLSKELFNLIYERTNELAESRYFNQITKFTQDVENLYKDIKSHDAIANIKKYAGIIWRFIKEKYNKLIPFGAEISEVFEEIWYEIKELEKVRHIQVIVGKFKELKEDMEWIAVEMRLKEHLYKLYGLINNKIRNFAFNALEVSDMYREAKTKFIFDPEVGAIEFEQKLPMSWHAFNETPKFYEIPEYQMVHKVANFLTASNMSILRQIYELRLNLDPKNWLPSHISRAFLLNSGFYITFDRRFVTLNTDSRKYENCSYLLAHDFWNNSFTLSLNLLTNPRKHNLSSATKFSLFTREHMIEIDLANELLLVDGSSNPLLPIKVDNLLVRREVDLLSIVADEGYKLECNMQFQLCWFEVNSRYFGRTAGLLGIKNNEPFDDFLTPSYKIASTNDLFIEAWNTNTRACRKSIVENATKIFTDKLMESCHQLFSSLTHCANYIDPAPFLNVCVESGYKSYSAGNSSDPHLPFMKWSCTAALAYVEVCEQAKIPMRVPQQCVFCELPNATLVPESTFVEYDHNFEPLSSDIVFLIEAKECATHTEANKAVVSVVSALEEQMQEAKFVNNRYAVVAYGTQLKPFVISEGNGEFVNQSHALHKYLAHVLNFINIDDEYNGNSDVLQAISTAARLNFRPGVTKTFILLSCSRCDVKQMRFDYSSILQYMSEEGVSLHILTDADFNLDKSVTTKSRNFFGFDKQAIYSNRFPEGEREMRYDAQQVSSASSLGICVPLALETGGSVFSTKKIAAARKYSYRRFATIFAKRVIKSAIPAENQTCECIGHRTGVAYMVCTAKKSDTDELAAFLDDSDFSEWDWEPESYDLGKFENV